MKGQILKIQCLHWLLLLLQGQVVISIRQLVTLVTIIGGEAKEILIIEVEEEVEMQVINHLIIITSLPSNHNSQVQAFLLQDQIGLYAKSATSLVIQL